MNTVPTAASMVNLVRKENTRTDIVFRSEGAARGGQVAEAERAMDAN